MVTSYFSELASTRVNRSINVQFSLAPPRPTGESMRKLGRVDDKRIGPPTDRPDLPAIDARCREMADES